MAAFRIKKLHYKGEEYQYESPNLNDKLVIFEGDNKGGKSTFADLVYFCLGGNPSQFKKDSTSTHTEIVNDKNNFVQIAIEIDGSEYLIKRRFGDKEIQIIQDDTLQLLSVSRHKDNFIFSDWILEKLGIPVIEIFQGTRSWKININDLMRLVYYDQNSELDRIYKNADAENFVSDSLEMRRLIFQLLVGKSYNAYYESLAKTKNKKKEFDTIKGAFDHNNEVADEILSDKESLNLKHLNTELNEKQEQIKKLYISREAIQKNRPKNTANLDEVENLKESLEAIEENLFISRRELGSKEKELFDLKYLKQNLVLEVTQLKKIITTHEKLGFFTPDTCPNCLRQVQREEGYCICGNQIEEDEYIKLFYSEEEYLDILKEKQNSIDTVSKSINALSGRFKKIETQVGSLSSKARSIENEIRSLLSEVSDEYNTSSIDRIDDKILELKSEISDLNEQIRIEEKRQSLQRKLDRARDELQSLENQTQALYSEAEQDMQERIKDFNTVYNDFMTTALKDCRSARIDQETYMPIINEGNYRERSARVPIRLMYFFTLLKLSVQSESLNFPKFILVDTPEDAGIDDENLIRCIEQINSILEEDDDFQIIMTTGMDKYPDEFSSYVVETLEDEAGKRLLKKVPKSDEEE